MFFLFGNSYALRKISFYLSIVLLSITILTFVFSSIRKEQYYNSTDAIIMSSIVVTKSSPDKSGTDLFQLHEGTKVKVRSKLANWIEIEIGNGEIGWVEENHIATI